MPRGSKEAYTDKQKRQARHIEDGYEARGVPEDEAAARAWATVNKETGGGKKSGSGRGKAVKRTASAKGGKTSGSSTTSQSRAAAGTKRSAAKSATAGKTASARKSATAGTSAAARNSATKKTSGGRVRTRQPSTARNSESAAGSGARAPRKRATARKSMTQSQSS